MNLPRELKLDTGEERANYRLWEALEEFQSLLLLIQRRNSVVVTPKSLRKLCGSLGALEGSVGLWPHSGFKGVEPPVFQNLRGSAGALGAPEPSRRSSSAVRAATARCAALVRQLLTAVAYCRLPVIQGACRAAGAIIQQVLMLVKRVFGSSLTLLFFVRRNLSTSYSKAWIFRLKAAKSKAW